MGTRHMHENKWTQCLEGYTATLTVLSSEEVSGLWKAGGGRFGQGGLLFQP